LFTKRIFTTKNAWDYVLSILFFNKGGKIWIMN